MTAEDRNIQQGKLAGQASADADVMFRHTAGMPNKFKSHMDFQLAHALSNAEMGAAAVGECLAASSHFVDGDFLSYTAAFKNLAERIEAKGHDCLARGHKVSAREAFLRASQYFHSAGYYTDYADPFNRTAYERQRACFRAAARLSDPLIEAINIPYENGRTLPGYYVRGGAPGEKRPTLLCTGGGDMCAESTYIAAGVGAVRRGYNVLSFEVPGQKGMAYESPDLFWRPDAEVPARYVLDYVLSRDEVDPARIALIGHSVGGYLAPRMAAFEKRITAIIASLVIWNIQPHFLEVLGFDPSKPYPRDMESQVDPANTSANYILGGDFRARCGHADTTIAEWIDYMGEFTIEHLADQITCPVLNMVGEGEFPPEKLAELKEKFKRLNNDKNRFNVTTAEEGGEAHCTVNNLTLKSQLEGDWLDEIFDWSL